MKKCDPPIFDPTSKALYCGDSKVGWFYIDLYGTNVYVMWPAGHDDVLRFMDETFPQIDRSAMSDHNGWNGKTLGPRPTISIQMFRSIPSSDLITN